VAIPRPAEAESVSGQLIGANKFAIIEYQMGKTSGPLQQTFVLFELLALSFHSLYFLY